MMRGGRIIKKATARCNPADKFSLKTGAELALSRLFEKKVSEVKRAARVGEYINAVRPLNSDERYSLGDILRVYAVSEKYPDQLLYAENTTERFSALITDEYVVLENYRPEGATC